MSDEASKKNQQLMEQTINNIKSKLNEHPDFNLTSHIEIDNLKIDIEIELAYLLEPDLLLSDTETKETIAMMNPVYKNKITMLLVLGNIESKLMEHPPSVLKTYIENEIDTYLLHPDRISFYGSQPF